MIQTWLTQKLDIWLSINSTPLSVKQAFDRIPLAGFEKRFHSFAT